MGLRRVKIGDFLKRIKRPVQIVDDVEYKLVTIRINHKGVALRELKRGAEVKSNMYEVRNGDFVLSGIDARNGAFGIISEELDGAIVTNDYWYFNVDEAIIDKQFFLTLTSTSWFDEICKRGSDGTTQRIRLQKDKFFDQEIMLPSIEEQKLLAKKVNAIQKKQLAISEEIAQQKELVTKLKQSILQDAISGKLTQEWRANNPNIEPATQLLKQIKATKQQQIKEGKLRKEKPLDPIDESTLPFPIPPTWTWCRLGDFGILKRGKSKHRPRNDKQLFERGTYPFIQTGDVAKARNNNDLITTINGYYNDFGLKQSEMQTIGTLCITIAANIAECGFLGFEACVPDSIVCFSSIHNCSEKYVYYYLAIAKKELEKYAPATAQKNINLGILNDLLIPIPPIDEQKLIVDMIYRKLHTCRNIESQIDNTTQTAQQLTKSILTETFERH